MKNQINELQTFIDKQKDSLKLKVRKKAISRAKSSLILNGKKAEDISDEDWEHLVADEESKIWQQYKTGGIAAVAALLGIAWFQMFIYRFIRDNFKALIKGVIPVALIYFVLNPLYWMWDPKISEIGYGIHLLVIFTLVYLFIFFWSLYHLRHIFSDEKTKQMKIARQSIAKEEDRLDRLMNLEAYPSLKSKSDKILNK